jgi:urease accessory protein UreH
MNSAAVTYDTEAREITLYPGNVERLKWTAHALFSVFGQAVDRNGKPIANASVQSNRGIGQTDEEGRFQMDVSAEDTLIFKTSGKDSCQVRDTGVVPHNDYASIGKVVCE